MQEPHFIRFARGLPPEGDFVSGEECSFALGWDEGRDPEGVVRSVGLLDSKRRAPLTFEIDHAFVTE